MTVTGTAPTCIGGKPIFAMVMVIGLAASAVAGSRVNVNAAASKAGKSVQDVRSAQQAQIPAGRYGTAEEFGAICAFLCSVQAGYMTGQNVLADGGGYPGAF